MGVGGEPLCLSLELHLDSCPCCEEFGDLLPSSLGSAFAWRPQATLLPAILRRARLPDLDGPWDVRARQNSAEQMRPGPGLTLGDRAASAAGCPGTRHRTVGKSGCPAGEEGRVQLGQRP